MLFLLSQREIGVQTRVSKDVNQTIKKARRIYMSLHPCGFRLRVLEKVLKECYNSYLGF